MSEPKDCRVIQGDDAVIISRNTAIEALHAMKKLADDSAYKMRYTDDASFVRDSFRELEKAVEA